MFTRKLCFVIECKNLYGNIEITNTGDFIRTTEFGGRKIKEGIYSPITQNQRHLELIKKLRVDNNSNIITKFFIGRYFEDVYKPVVVLANPKTVINAKYAKKEVKSQVIRADQLVKYIKDMYKTSKEPVYSDERLLDWAKSYLDLHKEVDKDYTEKYERYKICNSILTSKIEDKSDKEEKRTDANASIPVEESDIFRELKAYRLTKSREEKIKPYFIYNDKQLKDLISKMPRNKEQLMTVNGFDKIKADKYGDDILKIVKKYSL